MKRRHLWLLLVVALGAAVGSWLARRPRPAPPPQPPPEVAIQDGKTIDFSSGRPVVKDSPEEKAIIDRAVKEMDEAVKGVTFGPSTSAPPEEKKAPPPPAAALPQK